MSMSAELITGRYFQPGELKRLDRLVNKYGVPIGEIPGGKRNANTYEISWQEWWDPNGPHGGLHGMNPIRGGYFVDLLKRYAVPTDEPILDVGCGAGLLSEYLAKKGYNIIGVDLSKGAIQAAVEHPQQSTLNIKYLVGSVYNLPFPEGYFRAVVCSDFLEHIPNLDGAMLQISGALGSEGLFLCDTISRDDETQELSESGLDEEEETVVQFMNREKDGRIPAGTHDPRLFINRGELREIAQKYGIQILEDNLTLEDFDDKFRLRKITIGSPIGHYLGHGIKR